jgi:signal transduction histidine kinase
MLRLPIHRTRQFALLTALICALVIAIAACVVYQLIRSGISGVSLWLLIVSIGLVSSSLIALLVTVLFAHALRQRISELHRIVFPDTESVLSDSRPRSPMEEFEQLAHQIATDRRSLHQRNSELQILATISHTLTRASSLEKMLDTVLQQAPGLHPYSMGYVTLLDRETDRSRILASTGYSAEELAEQARLVADDVVPSDYISLPLRATSGMIGNICLKADLPDPDTWRSLNLLADILATTIEKQRLLESAQREIRAQKLLNEAGRVLTSTLDEQEVLTRIMREAVQALNAEAGSVVLVDEERGDMYFAAAFSPQAEHLVGMRLPLGQGVVGWSIEHRESVLSVDARNDPRHYQEIDPQTGFETKSIACVPLFSKDKVIGAIEVLNSRNGQFTPHDLQLLESLSPQAAIAIENASLFESIKTQMEELERAQDQLLQAEKLSAIGRLVAGVAHELNNPLTAIVGYSQLLLETCEDREICDDLERINREAQRSARIVQNLLAFARQQKAEKLPIDVTDVLEKTLDLLAYQLEVDNITLVPEISPHRTVILGDSYQIQQVFLNLITNAHHAMRSASGRGTLTIRTEQSDHDTVRIYFIDDGPGIPREIASRVFDPFFTTKDVGEGTGLGLSICLGILQEHEGQIWLDETAPRGATFVVELPLYHERHTGQWRNEIHEKPAPLDRLAILVVDDEHEIALLLKRILESEGHEVVTVADGLEARDILSEQHFDLLICDLKMPGMSGRELYSYIEQAHPDMAQRVIFSTGDTVSQESWAFLSKVQNRCISKPFKPDEVLSEVRGLVAG